MRRHRHHLDTTYANPLRVENTTDWTYANGEPFDPTSDFGMDLTNFNSYECVHLRASSEFAARVTNCPGKVYPFVCVWAGADSCPSGYAHHGSISDGRTCFGLGSDRNGPGKDMCRMGSDDLSRPSLPSSALMAQVMADKFR